MGAVCVIQKEGEWLAQVLHRAQGKAMGYRERHDGEYSLSSKCFAQKSTGRVLMAIDLCRKMDVRSLRLRRR